MTLINNPYLRYFKKKEMAKNSGGAAFATASQKAFIAVEAAKTKVLKILTVGGSKAEVKQMD